MRLFGHLSNCSVAFAMYISVHYDYRAINEIIFNIPRVLNPINSLSSKKKNLKIVALYTVT